MIQPLCSEHRKATSSAVSAGFLVRPSGLCSACQAWSSSLIQPVSLGPGLTALTVMPADASSAAADIVIHSIAPLLAA